MAKLVVAVMLLLATMAGSTLATAQLPANPMADAPTAERLQQPGWWPTKPLSAAQKKELVGNEVCAQCHGDIERTQRETEMARTLTLAGKSDVLQHLNAGAFRLGRFQYTLESSADERHVTASGEGKSAATAIDWVFGSGTVGQSYYWDHDGSGHESRFSYFNSIRQFDLTPGLTSPDSLDVALGRKLSNPEARTCFACHSTVLTNAKPESPHDLVAGVGCETCHGPGALHVAAADARDPKLHALIFSPRSMTPSESVNVCGACHRTSADVEMMGLSGVGTVRFPAFRLQESRCWGASGSAKLTCVACHDPHRPLVREAEMYDAKCLACHQAKAQLTARADHPGKACPVASNRCTTCHMPKFELPDMHSKFTDHRIRVASASQPFPQ